MTSSERHVFGEHHEHADTDAQRAVSGAVVPLREEELTARKTSVETGQVSLGTELVEAQQTLEVPVSHEEVTIERQPVDHRPSAEPISASSETVSVPLHEEQVVLSKQPVVYEVVSLGKRAVQQTQHVSETVRKEVVDVDATGEVDVANRASTQ